MVNNITGVNGKILLLQSLERGKTPLQRQQLIEGTTIKFDEHNEDASEFLSQSSLVAPAIQHHLFRVTKVASVNIDAADCCSLLIWPVAISSRSLYLKDKVALWSLKKMVELGANLNKRCEARVSAEPLTPFETAEKHNNVAAGTLLMMHGAETETASPSFVKECEDKYNEWVESSIFSSALRTWLLAGRDKGSIVSRLPSDLIHKVSHEIIFLTTEVPNYEMEEVSEVYADDSFSADESIDADRELSEDSDSETSGEEGPPRKRQKTE